MKLPFVSRNKYDHMLNANASLLAGNRTLHDKVHNLERALKMTEGVAEMRLATINELTGAKDVTERDVEATQGARRMADGTRLVPPEDETAEAQPWEFSPSSVPSFEDDDPPSVGG